MDYTRDIKLLTPLLVMSLLTSTAAKSQTVLATDGAAMTGQLMQWATATFEQPSAPTVATNRKAAPKLKSSANVIRVDDLIATGSINVDSLTETPAKAPAKLKPSQRQEAEPAGSSLESPAGLVNPVLTVSASAGGLVFSPESLTFAKAGDKVTVRLATAEESGLQLFVRDQKIAELSAAATELTARKAGSTELYAVANGRMYIIQVRVESGASRGPNLTVPKALVSLNGVVKVTGASATYPGLEQATQADPAPAPVSAGDVSSDEVNPTAPSLKTSIAETARSLLRQASDGRRFYNAKEKIGYTTAQVQLIDDRSNPGAGLIYPVSGVSVRVLGTEFISKTDATGHLTIRDMPRQARFMLRIDDPSGQYRPAIAEISTEDLMGGVTRIRVMRSFAFDALTTIASSVQQSTHGSYCSVVSDRDGGGHLGPAADIAVQIDVAAEGPFYFNKFGFLDRTMSATGSDGRFCYFNVAPGPMAISLFKRGDWVATLPLSVFANRHLEEHIDLSAVTTFATQFASMATAQEQLSSDVSTAAHYQQVDMIDLLPLGSDAPLPQVAPGRVANVDGLVSHQGKVRAFARAAEFEPVVYTYRAGDEQTVTPLIPRGFIDDMSLNAQVVHDPELGSVLAEFAAPEGATQETISMRLVDQDGHDVGDGWYFSDAPLTKALFFNVPAGTYSLQVQTKAGYWLNSDTVMVYNETTSYMRLGTMLRYQP